MMSRRTRAIERRITSSPSSEFAARTRRHHSDLSGRAISIEPTRFVEIDAPSPPLFQIVKSDGSTHCDISTIALTRAFPTIRARTLRACPRAAIRAAGAKRFSRRQLPPPDRSDEMDGDERRAFEFLRRRRHRNVLIAPLLRSPQPCRDRRIHLKTRFALTPFARDRRARRPRRVHDPLPFRHAPRAPLHPRAHSSAAGFNPSRSSQRLHQASTTSQVDT